MLTFGPKNVWSQHLAWLSPQGKSQETGFLCVLQRRLEKNLSACFKSSWKMFLEDYGFPKVELLCDAHEKIQLPPSSRHIFPCSAWQLCHFPDSSCPVSWMLYLVPVATPRILSDVVQHPSIHLAFSTWNTLDCRGPLCLLEANSNILSWNNSTFWGN